MIRQLDKTMSQNEYSRVSAADASVAQSRLKRSGIACRIATDATEPEQQDSYTASYTVRVRQLTPIFIRLHLQGGSSFQHEPDLRTGAFADGLHRRLGKAAVRTLYTLGAGEGEVKMTIRPGRGYFVDEVRLKNNGRKMVMSAAPDRSHASPPGQAHRAEEQPEHTLLMGMDPEFVLVRDGRIVLASEFMDRVGTVGCDSVREQDELIFPLAELRPDPQPDPAALLTEMRKALREASKMITDRSLAWKAGGLPVPDYPLGGHIHFSGVTLTLDVLQALDNYLALPLLLVEDPRGRGRRPRYGFLGDFRRQPHGGFEYRTLPSFLVSPFVTKVSLSIAYLVVRYSDRLQARPLNTERYHRAFYEGGVDLLKECMRGWHRDMSSLPEYPKYAPEIEQLLKFIQEGRTWNESRDIRPLWNIPVKP